jgi:hypothetical protein
VYSQRIKNLIANNVKPIQRLYPFSAKAKLREFKRQAEIFVLEVRQPQKNINRNLLV